MNTQSEIRERIEQIRKEIPDTVEILGAAKTRTVEEIQAAYDAGLRIFGHNYVQEAQLMIPKMELDVEWHLIGHLQRNKARSAAALFGMVESLDSIRLGKELEKHCAEIRKEMPVLIEVNSGREENKTGVLPEDALGVAEWLSKQPHLHLVGLMTMGPRTGDPELSRPFFKETRRIFEEIQHQDFPHTCLRILSMGMSNSYMVAVDEGATLVRLGTSIFGLRKG